MYPSVFFTETTSSLLNNGISINVMSVAATTAKFLISTPGSVGFTGTPTSVVIRVLMSYAILS